MTVAPEPRRPPARPRRVGLRLRLWLGCIAATGSTAAGIAWVLWFGLANTAAPAPGELPSRLALVVLLGSIAGVVLAAWLDHGIVGRLRALAQNVEQGVIQRPRRGGAGWGEIAALTDRVEAQLARQRQLAWAADELERLKRQIDQARDAVERWTVRERWEPPLGEEGALQPLLESLNRGFARQREVLEQNREAARQVQGDLQATLAEARDAAEQAEHGFVEATAALTSIQELERLGGELVQLVAEPPVRDAAAPEPWRAAAAEAIEELVGGAGESVEHLAAGFLKVREIGEQVHLVSNRATLIALHTLLAGAHEEGAAPAESLHAELKQLSLEARGATARVAELSRELDGEIQAAAERMRGLRERVAARLERIGERREPAGAAADARRLLDRAREMIQDAARTCERVNQSAEGASRAAQEVARRLEEQSADLDGLLVRLSPPAEPESPGARSATLRVLGRRSEERGDPGRTRGRGEIA